MRRRRRRRERSRHWGACGGTAGEQTPTLPPVEDPTAEQEDNPERAGAMESPRWSRGKHREEAAAEELSWTDHSTLCVQSTSSACQNSRYLTSVHCLNYLKLDLFPPRC